MPGVLSEEQLRQIQRCAEMNDPELAQRYAVRWGVPTAEVVREYRRLRDKFLQEEEDRRLRRANLAQQGLGQPRRPSDSATMRQSAGNRLEQARADVRSERADDDDIAARVAARLEVQTARPRHQLGQVRPAAPGSILRDADDDPAARVAMKPAAGPIPAQPTRQPEMKPPAPRGLMPRSGEMAANSPVANVHVDPAAFAHIGRNWLLIDARLKRGMSRAQVGSACGIRPADLRAMEDGRMLPSPPQAARLCALLELTPDQTFIATGEEQSGARGDVRSFLLFDLWLANRRIAFMEFCDMVYDQEKLNVTKTLRKLRNGKLGTPLTTAERKDLEATARVMGVSDWKALLERVPSAMVQTSAQRTTVLHHALKATDTGGAQLTLSGAVTALLTEKAGER